MLTGKIEVWEEYAQGGSRESRAFEYEMQKAKSEGFLPGVSVKFPKMKNVGTITYYNSAYHNGFDPNGEPQELHVRFDGYACDVSHRFLEVVK